MKSPALLSRLARIPPLTLALALSVALHAALLLVRTVAPEQFNRVFRDTPLEVILVNANTADTPPEKAQAIAQTALAGGGDAAEGRATSPLPYSALTAVGNDLEDRQRQIEAMQEQQAMLLTQLRQHLAALPEFNPTEAATDPGQHTDPEQQEERRRQLLKQLAEIEKRVSDENARPRKRYISPATREEVYALYYDSVRRKVEDKGTANFPEHNGNKLYGHLIMMMTVGSDGSVLDTEVLQSSGNPVLDRRAEAIARASGPFDPFPAEVRARYEQMAPVFTFKFTRDQLLEAAVR